VSIHFTDSITASCVQFVEIANEKYYFEGITGTIVEGQAIPEEGQ
jgi:hypothetical protein